MPMASSSDPTGVISPQVSVLRVNEAIPSYTWINALTEGDWSVVGLKFTYDSLLPSRAYITEFSVQDFGGRGSGNVTRGTVDNDIPVANAGIDQTVPAGQMLYLDGTGSTDSSGIANYTWLVDNAGTPVTLWGPNPDFTFLSEGTFDVVLTVRDGAGHTSTDTMTITVSAAIPEFPTLILPVVGMILVIAVFRISRGKPGE